MEQVYRPHTHTHADHISGAAALKDVTECLYLMHEDAPSRCANFRVHDSFEWDCLDVPATVLHTPGHTRDSICLLFPDWIFTGDTLFQFSVGRTDFPGCSHSELMNSIHTKLMVLPDDTIVYPGHGPQSTIGTERQWNPFVRGQI